MLLRIAFAAALAAGSGSAQTGTMTSDAVPESIQLEYEVTRNPDGSLEFTELNGRGDLKTFFPADVDMDAALSALKSTPIEGWAVSDQSGRLKNVFMADWSDAIPDSIAQSVGIGDSLTKVQIAAINGIDMPSQAEIKAMFDHAVETIIEQVCSQPKNRQPADMTTSFTVGVSAVLQASVLVSARWETENVCL